MKHKINLLEDQAIKSIVCIPVYKRLEFWIVMLGAILLLIGLFI